MHTLLNNLSKQILMSSKWQWCHNIFNNAVKVLPDKNQVCRVVLGLWLRITISWSWMYHIAFTSRWWNLQKCVRILRYAPDVHASGTPVWPCYNWSHVVSRLMPNTTVELFTTITLRRLLLDMWGVQWDHQTVLRMAQRNMGSEWGIGTCRKKYSTKRKGNWCEIQYQWVLGKQNGYIYFTPMLVSLALHRL